MTLNNTSEEVQEAFDIYIVGTGIVSVQHITHEIDAVLRRSKEVLYVDNSFGIREYLEQVCPKVTNLHPIAYREGEERINAYNIMTAKVIEAALDNPPVTFALYGHPLVFANPPFQVLKIAPLFGLRVKVLPGISAMDTLFVDLGLDPSVQGLQMYEATDLLLRQHSLQPNVPCLIWQIGTVESRLYSESMSKPKRFTRIKNYLLKFYPSNHKLVAVYSSTYPLVKSSRTVFCLKDIESYAECLHQGVTVYIPPIESCSVADHELYSKIDSTDYLQKITNNH
ncbi:MAG: SAM-dependent methyltransferase [Cyanobacteria bacterium P01_A01_bin.68]